MIDPRGLTFPHWASQTTLLIVPYGTVPVPDERHWQGWAAAVISFPQFGSIGAPQPAMFKRWEDWAHIFNLQLSQLGI
jgi:hypothetical protein